MFAIKSKLPATTAGAGDIARLTTGVAAAFASIFFPPAALAGPALDFAIKKFVDRPKKLLLEELKAGNVETLTDEAAAEFVPMAYRFLEAAKEGEYEHNLKVIGAYIAGELQQDEPEASNVARMARRIEGLSKRELRTIALVATCHHPPKGGIGFSLTGAANSEDFDDVIGAFWVSADKLAGVAKGLSKGGWVSSADSQSNEVEWELQDRSALVETLAELAGRGLLVPNLRTFMDKHEEYYHLTASFDDLIKKASEAIERAAVNS